MYELLLFKEHRYFFSYLQPLFNTYPGAIISELLNETDVNYIQLQPRHAVLINFLEFVSLP
jgi:hypothetical protein